jgi:hypothetical protein
LGQWRKLFTMFRYSSLRWLNIFGPRDGVGFEFRCTEEFHLLVKYQNWAGPQANGPFPLFTGHTGTWSRAAHHGASHHMVTAITALSLPALGVAGHRRPTWVSGLILTCGCRQRNPSPFSFPLTTIPSRPSLYSRSHFRPPFYSLSPAAARWPRRCQRRYELELLAAMPDASTSLAAASSPTGPSMIATLCPHPAQLTTP